MTMRDQGDAVVAPAVSVEGDARPSRMTEYLFGPQTKELIQPVFQAPTVVDTATKNLPGMGVDTTGGATILREHTVGSKDTLWSIARNQLKQDGSDASAQNVHKYVKQIVAANAEANPDLARNPDKLSPGMKLAIPQYKPGSGEAPVVAREPRTERHERQHARHERQQARKEGEPQPGRERTRAGDVPEFDPSNAEESARKIVASWYGGKFHGRQTASGDTYNMYGMTAAHKTLPLGTMIEVTNPATKEQVILRVNDRGPYKPGRDLDLSYAAARKLGTVDEGVAPLQMRIIGKGPRRVNI